MRCHGSNASKLDIAYAKDRVRKTIWVKAPWLTAKCYHNTKQHCRVYRPALFRRLQRTEHRTHHSICIDDGEENHREFILPWSTSRAVSCTTTIAAQDSKLTLLVDCPSRTRSTLPRLMHMSTIERWVVNNQSCTTGTHLNNRIDESNARNTEWWGLQRRSDDNLWMETRSDHEQALNKHGLQRINRSFPEAQSLLVRSK